MLPVVEASKCVFIFDRGTGYKLRSSDRPRSGSPQTDMILTVCSVFGMDGGDYELFVR